MKQVSTIGSFYAGKSFRKTIDAEFTSSKSMRPGLLLIYAIRSGKAMMAILQSLLIYSCIIAVFATIVHSKGRYFAQLETFEFLFLFIPWLTIVVMAYIFFGSVEALYKRSPIWLYFWLLQVVGAGIIGSFVLMPRYFFKADTVTAKILVNSVASLSISALFAYTRLLLFALTSEVSAADWPEE